MYRKLLHSLAVVITVIHLFVLVGSVHGAGTVSSADETSLRAAMVGGGLVTFAVDGTITLTNTLDISVDTTLDATGQSVTLDGGNAVRIFYVNPGVSLHLQNLTVVNGRSNQGAGMYNLGSVDIVGSTFLNNRAIEPVETNPGIGGAIYNRGNLTVIGSTFDQNYAIGGIAGFGGAIANVRTLSATNCTFHGNGVEGTFLRQGGGIYNDASASIVHCTFSGNSASTGGAISIGSGAQSQFVQGTILADNPSGGTSYGQSDIVEDGGYNLCSDSGGGAFTNSTSLINTDPELGPLADYGGRTWTMSLLAGSPAMDAGSAGSEVPSVDQRGIPRPSGAARDIGAFESAPPYTLLVRFRGFLLPRNITVSYGTNSTTSDANGLCIVPGFSAGLYDITPSYPDRVFIPSNTTVSIQADGVTDFEAYHLEHLAPAGISNGVFRCVFAGNSGESHQILQSTNMADWFPLSTNTVGADGIFEFFYTNPVVSGVHLYRTKKL